MRIGFGRTTHVRTISPEHAFQTLAIGTMWTGVACMIVAFSVIFALVTLGIGLLVVLCVRHLELGYAEPPLRLSALEQIPVALARVTDADPERVTWMAEATRDLTREHATAVREYMHERMTTEQLIEALDAPAMLVSVLTGRISRARCRHEGERLHFAHDARELCAECRCFVT